MLMPAPVAALGQPGPGIGAFGVLAAHESIWSDWKTFIFLSWWRSGGPIVIGSFRAYSLVKADTN